MIRSLIVFSILLAVKVLARLFYRFKPVWLGPVSREQWNDLRLIVVLHHTSLMDVLFFGLIPLRVLWGFATRGVVPAAAVTLERPLIGLAYRTMAKTVIPLTRKRDHTWESLLSQIDDDAMSILAPEGRLMRRNGLDKKGNPMSIRGGVVDILRAMPRGQMLLIYSGGLHHVQIPGEHRFPRPFKTVHGRFEMLDLTEYCNSLLDVSGEEGFRQAVIDDLQRRRDLHCPATGFPDPAFWSGDPMGETEGSGLREPGVSG